MECHDDLEEALLLGCPCILDHFNENTFDNATSLRILKNLCCRDEPLYFAVECFVSKNQEVLFFNDADSNENIFSFLCKSPEINYELLDILMRFVKDKNLPENEIEKIIDSHKTHLRNIGLPDISSKKLINYFIHEDCDGEKEF